MGLDQEKLSHKVWQLYENQIEFLPSLVCVEFDVPFQSKMVVNKTKIVQNRNIN